MAYLTWDSGTTTNDKSNTLLNKYSTYATVDWSNFLENTSSASNPYQQWLNDIF